MSDGPIFSLRLWQRRIVLLLLLPFFCIAVAYKDDPGILFHDWRRAWQK